MFVFVNAYYIYLYLPTSPYHARCLNRSIARGLGLCDYRLDLSIYMGIFLFLFLYIDLSDVGSIF